MFAEKLKQVRKRKKLTQTALAELCGISRNSIVNWETGKNTPKIGDIEKLSLALGLSPQELIGISTTENHEGEDRQDNTTPKGYAYWGGIVDEARKVAERGDIEEMNSIEPLLKLAYKVLLTGIGKIKQVRTEDFRTGVSAYNGDNSSYMGNSLTVGAPA